MSVDYSERLLMAVGASNRRPSARQGNQTQSLGPVILKQLTGYPAHRIAGDQEKLNADATLPVPNEPDFTYFFLFWAVRGVAEAKISQPDPKPFADLGGVSLFNKDEVKFLVGLQDINAVAYYAKLQTVGAGGNGIGIDAFLVSDLVNILESTSSNQGVNGDFVSSQPSPIRVSDVSGDYYPEKDANENGYVHTDFVSPTNKLVLTAKAKASVVFPNSPDREAKFVTWLTPLAANWNSGPSLTFSKAELTVKTGAQALALALYYSDPGKEEVSNFKVIFDPRDGSVTIVSLVNIHDLIGKILIPKGTKIVNHWKPPTPPDPALFDQIVKSRMVSDGLRGLLSWVDDSRIKNELKKVIATVSKEEKPMVERSLSKRGSSKRTKPNPTRKTKK